MAVEVDDIHTAVLLPDAEEVLRRHAEDMTDDDHVHTGMADDQ